MCIQLTKIAPDFKLPVHMLATQYAKEGAILRLNIRTQYWADSSTLTPVWLAETLNYPEKGIVQNIYVFPNFEEAILLTGAQYMIARTKAEARELELGRLALLTGTGHAFTTGSDPEIFVVDEHDIVIPAWEFLGPEDQLERKADNLIPFWDGFQAEFNITPGGCHAQRVDQIQSQLKKLLALARTKFPKARLTSRAVLDIPSEMMDKISDQHAGLGCSPSKNLYKTKPLHVENPRALPFRFAGFHIHFGCQHDKLLVERIRAMDQILGPISVSLLRGLDDSRRRTFYGKAGEYRTPTHGLEWRVLSSTALCHPIIVNLMFDIARLVQALPDGNYANLWQVAGGDDRIQHIINEYDDDEARRLLKENEPIFKSIINSLYGTSRGNKNVPNLTKKIETLILKGAKEFLDADAIESNWLLKDVRWQAHSAAPNESVSTMTLKGLD